MATRRKRTTQNNTGVAGMSVEMIDIEQLANIEELRLEIDRLDAEILAAVRRRAEVSREIGRARMASGGTRLVHSREMKVIQRYSELGPEGKDLAMLLLRLGRGRLGH
ncbi:chorismate mutase [Mycobacterium lentiflavum]|uniref:Chorismate mutase n=1 Tax=Mycobacterium lentiflavum TaxID=141349 RepID=A0ABY3UPX9_MYCLN|nr:chorismate mutase [Mycobacterium lentiflavum]ULP41646.2 chorismate mutase [Mycobacterium lentiflavum]